jgi:glucosamine kinase
VADRSPPTPPILLGVDVGGSHTAAALARSDGTVLARVEGPGAAVRPGQTEATAATIAEVVARAAQLAGVTLPADRAVIGAAGAGRTPERAELRTRLATHRLARRLEVTTDGEIALVAAFGTEPGIVVCAGTGSIAYARDPQGALHRAGGYGWQLGDEGGGYWIGRQALAAAGRAEDHRGAGIRSIPSLLRTAGLTDFDGLVRWAATATPSQVAALAPGVLHEAEEGQEAAQRILDGAAQALGDLVLALASRFPAGHSTSVAASGALLGQHSPLRVAVRESLRSRDPRLGWEDVAVDGPLGAIRLATELR